MDYKGQLLCEYLYSTITIAFAVVAWFVGWYHGEFFLTFKGWSGGMVLALLVSYISFSFVSNS